MRIKIAKIDDVDILLDWTYGIFYSKTQRRKLSVDDDSDDKAWSHWRYVSPTYARVRQIVFEWYIENMWNIKEQDAFEHLQSLFALQWRTWKLQPKKLYVKDVHDNEWIMDVKVSEPLDIQVADEDMRDYARERRIELESVEDPRYYSFEEVQTNILEWDFGGFTMGFSMDFSMDEYSNITTLVTTWNSYTPMRREIDVISDFDAPITIRNITSWQQMQFDVGGVVWDKIVVDTWKYKATKNWQDITSTRMPWSDRLQIEGEESFVIFSKDWWLDHSDFDVNIFFRHVLL